MILKTSFILAFTLSLSGLNLIIAQDCCDTDSRIVLCYTPGNAYCTFPDCNFNYDGFYMQGLSAKIGNPDNFGLNGTVSCLLATEELVNINTVEDIEALSCDIIFIGNYSTENNGGFGSTLAIPFLETIREWSIKCEENLTILFQGEAEVWGYQISDINANPNIPGQNIEINIFDGPFGSLDEFDQGGSFQAVFSELPNSGSIILARDGRGQPSVILDTETNDIVLSDVGIMSNGLGPISRSSEILNNNDILACNIIALGCDIATKFNYEEIVICPGSSYTLPNGDMVDEEGEFLSQLTSDGGCDSLLFTTIVIDMPRDTLLSYDGCSNDGFDMQVGQVLFNESNPSGFATLENQYGCDSIVEVTLNYESLPQESLDTVICAEDSFIFEGYEVTEALDSVFIISRASACDSTVRLTVSIFDFPTVVIDNKVIITNDAPYTFSNEIPSSYTILWTPNTDLSCSDCPNPVLTNESNITLYTLSLSSGRDNCIQNFEIPVTYLCSFYMPNVFSPNALGADKTFGPMAPCNLMSYEMSIYDKWGAKVFSSEDIGLKWDGRKEGKNMLAGLYVYSLTYVDGAGVEQSKAGYVQLMR